MKFVQSWRKLSFRVLIKFVHPNEMKLKLHAKIYHGKLGTSSVKFCGISAESSCSPGGVGGEGVGLLILCLSYTYHTDGG